MIMILYLFIEGHVLKSLYAMRLILSVLHVVSETPSYNLSGCVEKRFNKLVWPISCCRMASSLRYTEHLKSIQNCRGK